MNLKGKNHIMQHGTKIAKKNLNILVDPSGWRGITVAATETIQEKT